jgi:glutamate-ammonia-ligase adenylyltransferase
VKPKPEALTAACPGVDEKLVAEHLARLDEAYFDTFDLEAVAAHLTALDKLSADNPVELLFAQNEDGRCHCTVLAFDYPGEFSLITGVLAALGFSIVSGDVFTYRPAPTTPVARGRGRTRGRKPPARDPLRRRRIIDHFAGDIDAAPAFEDWCAAARERMAAAIGRLERGEDGEAKHLVNEIVADRLGDLQADACPLFYPVDIHVDNEGGPYTTLRVISQDTPAFLYALSTALSLQGIVIEHVRIRTTESRVEDELDVLDSRGEKILTPDFLGRVKLTVLLTKQFTYFLSNAPNPYAALCRFEQLVGDVVALPEHGRWVELLSSPRALQDLARLLGASDFIWEDLIRQQYEVLIPVLEPHVRGRRFSLPAETLADRLEEALRSAPDYESTRTALNEFKDREIFLIDLDHILHPASEVADLAASLTALAELVVRTAARVVYDHLVAQFGTPRTVAGLPARYAVFGLGKLGGAALGYASDIELLFVYSDSGKTDGAEPVENGEFFERLVKETASFITAKREGIFHVDLRLRPHGKNGPWACSLESFCRYYGAGGAAHSYERLALVRLRAVGGDGEFGAQVERLRDEFVYAQKSVDVAEFRRLRERQYQEKVPHGRYNAKFSPGALVDLEYDVQLLQVMFGRDDPRLRTPKIHEALRALWEAGVMAEAESRQVAEAYYFLRHLINGLRMLRGSAQDLFLPTAGSVEFAHLARRMGYERGRDTDPAQALYLEFEKQTAAVRAFVERHFGREFLPGPAYGTVADLVLSEHVPSDLRTAILEKAGFANAPRAYVNLRSLADGEARRDLFAKLAVLACDTLARAPDPDMALNNWDRFVRDMPDVAEHYRMLLAQPRRLEILLGLFSGSQFLADTLIRSAEFFSWVTDPGNLHAPRDRDAVLRGLHTFAAEAGGHDEWLDALRRFRRRELLRIGTRDLCLRVPIADVMADLSALAEAITDAAVERLWQERAPGGEEARDFCVMALGKLGGSELNYSSDIDLLGLCRDPAAGESEAASLAARQLFDRIMEGTRRDLSAHTAEGYAYRVDLRLRPYGRSGRLVRTVAGLVRYYRGDASLWEIQALLKMRPVAGNRAIGHAFLDRVRPLLVERREAARVVENIRRMRREAIKARVSRLVSSVDVKTGLGGLRDVEFLVQGLQLIHAWRHPEIIGGNTVASLAALREAGLLPADVAEGLTADYLFLRRVEHFLQIMEDRQIHVLPQEPHELAALARRVLGRKSSAEHFLDALNECQTRIRAAYTAHLIDAAL